MRLLVVLLLFFGSGCWDSAGYESERDAPLGAHVFGFGCTYLFVPVLEGELIIPGEYLQGRDVSKFTSELNCGDERYPLLVCGIRGLR